MRVGAFSSTILPLLSTFAMVAVTPSAVLAGERVFNRLDGGAEGTLSCSETDETSTSASWTISVDDPARPILFVNTALTTDNGLTERFIFFVIPASPSVNRSIEFDNDPESVELTGFVSGIGYRYIINPDEDPLEATCH